jgi:hypothetical protein
VTRPDPEYLKLAVKAAAREALWAATCSHHQGDDRNILLFATRRGGSTFAMELIGANRGIRTLNQPLETQTRNPTAAQMALIPRFQQGQITSVDESTDERLYELMTAIFAGRVVINAPTRVWRRDVDWRSNRLVLKITDAKPVIEWFDDRLDADIVYLTRHPIPQALSCIRNKWTLTVDAHLRDPIFVEANLTDAALALAHDVMATGTLLQQFVLNWALENVAPMRLLPTHPSWTHVRYEDCVLAPEATLGLLAERLRLGDVARMHDMLRRPSVSSRISTEDTRREISSGRAADVVTRWRQSVDVDEERQSDRILDTFGIDRDVVLPGA